MSEDPQYQPEDQHPDEGREFTRAELAAMLGTVYLLRQNVKRDEAALDTLTGKEGVIRQWQQANREEQLYDEQYELDAKWVSGARGFDFRSLAGLKNAGEVLVVLAKYGLLRFDFQAWSAVDHNFAEANIVRQYIMPGGEQLRLEVRRR